MNRDQNHTFDADQNLDRSHDFSVWGSFRRIILATLVAVPSTAAIAALLFLVPANVAVAFGIAGVVVFILGKGLNRPILMAIGGVVMFAGVFSWAVRQ